MGDGDHDAVIVIEGKAVSAVEDEGRLFIVKVGGADGLNATLTSWEDWGEGKVPRHVALSAVLGRRVRVTVEVLP